MQRQGQGQGQGACVRRRRETPRGVLHSHSVVAVALLSVRRSDITWLSEPPFDPFAWAGSRGCVFGHSVLHPGDSCNAGSHDAALMWARTYGVRARSADYPWMQTNSPMPYGNLVFIATSLLRSVEVRHMCQFLYESPRWSGYFRSRWGDQAVWPQILGTFLDIPDIRSDTLVCDLTAWRKQYFDHKIETPKNNSGQLAAATHAHSAMLALPVLATVLLHNG